MCVDNGISYIAILQAIATYIAIRTCLIQNLNYVIVQNSQILLTYPTRSILSFAA